MASAPLRAVRVLPVDYEPYVEPVVAIDSGAGAPTAVIADIVHMAADPPPAPTALERVAQVVDDAWPHTLVALGLVCLLLAAYMVHVRYRRDWCTPSLQPVRIDLAPPRQAQRRHRHDDDDGMRQRHRRTPHDRVLV